MLGPSCNKPLRVQTSRSEFVAVQEHLVTRAFMTELGAIFSRLGLEQYLNVFLTEGFETWGTVLDITESDLYDVC